MIITIDLDEVIADYIGNFLLFHNMNFGTNLKMSSFTHYTLSESIGIPREEEMRRIDAFDESSYFEEIPLIKDAQKIIKQLAKDNELIIVTGRPENQKEKTLKWLNKFVPEIKKIHFIRKHSRDNSKTKLEFCKEAKSVLHIEDNLTYAEEIANAGINVILFDYPWNRKENLNPLIRRVSSWIEVIPLIREMKKAKNL